MQHQNSNDRIPDLFRHKLNYQKHRSNLNSLSRRHTNNSTSSQNRQSLIDQYRLRKQQSFHRRTFNADKKIQSQNSIIYDKLSKGSKSSIAPFSHSLEGRLGHDSLRKRVQAKTDIDNVMLYNKLNRLQYMYYIEPHQLMPRSQKMNIKRVLRLEIEQVDLRRIKVRRNQHQSQIDTFNQVQDLLLQVEDRQPLSILLLLLNLDKLDTLPLRKGSKYLLFENNLQAKAHLKRIQNAKPTLLSSKHRASQTSRTPFLNQVQLMLHLYDLSEFQSIPIYKLLKPVNLQQYTRQLIFRGYGVNIGRLTLLSDKEKMNLYDEIKVLPGHSIKFNKIIASLVQLTQGNESTYSAESSSSIKQSKRESRNIDVEFEDQLSKVMNQYSNKSNKNPQSEKIESSKILASSKRNFKKQKSIESVRVRLPQIEKSESSSKAVVERKKQDISTIRQDSYKKPQSKQLYKRNTDIMSKTTIKTSSTVKKSLPPTTKSLSQKKPVHFNKAPVEIDLQVDKIRKKLISIDGGIMTSTIVNVDLEEICFCISTYLQKLIKQPERKVVKDVESHRSYQKQSQSQDINLDDVNNILRESYLHPLYNKDQQNQNIENQYENEQYDEKDNLSQGQVQQQIQQTNQDIRTRVPVQQSSFFGHSSVSFGLTNSIQIFEQPQPTQLDYYVPSVDCLTNFIKNVIVSAKMQRQIPIISLLYIIKFITKSKLQLTSLNYKRVLVSCMLLASKIWDDESFETPSFSHTFPEYSTVLLNEMEKQILIAINYELKLNKKEYALLYYEIRQYKKANVRSFQNRLLSIKRVMELQKGVSKCYRADNFKKRKSF